MKNIAFILILLGLITAIGFVIYLDLSYNSDKPTSQKVVQVEQKKQIELPNSPIQTKEKSKLEEITHLKQPTTQKQIRSTIPTKKAETSLTVENIKAEPSLTINLAEESLPLDPPILTSPLDSLSQLFEEKKYDELIKTIDNKEWYQLEPQALAFRLAAVLELSHKHIKTEKYDDAIFILEHQLNMNSDAPKAYSILAQAYTSKGKIKNALQVLNDGSVIVSDREQAETLLVIQSNMVNQHIKFLQDNEHWLELIKFIDTDPIQGSDDYYLYKLTAAQAYIEIYELDKAEEQLTLAAFDPELHSQINNLKKEILKRRNELAEQALEEEQPEDPELIKIPITLKGDSIYVKVHLNEKRYVKLLLDTGASITHLSTNTKSALGSKGVFPDGDRIFITASGKLRAPVARIELVSMGEAGVSNLLVAFSDIFSKESGIDGLLGMNFLRFYNFSFNFDEGFLELKPKGT